MKLRSVATPVGLRVLAARSLSASWCRRCVETPSRRPASAPETKSGSCPTGGQRASSPPLFLLHEHARETAELMLSHQFEVARLVGSIGARLPVRRARRSSVRLSGTRVDADNSKGFRRPTPLEDPVVAAEWLARKFTAAR